MGTYSHESRCQHGERATELAAMLSEECAHEFVLGFAAKPSQPSEDYTGRYLAESKNELAEIVIGRQQDRVGSIGQLENACVGCAWARFENRSDFMAVSAQPLDYRPVDALIGDDIHASSESTG